MDGDALLPGLGNEVLVTALLALIVIVYCGVITVKMYNSSGQRSDASCVRDGGQRRTYDSEVCPICISPHVLAVETNCGHNFCGACLRSYLNNRNPGDFSIFNGRLSCPMCRQDINILLPNFTQEEAQSTALESERASVEATVNQYNVRFGPGPRSVWSYVRDCPVLIRHLIQDFFSLGGVVWMFRLRVIVCLLASLFYLGNPIDVIPEGVFGIIGFFDDTIVFFLSAIYLSVIYRRLVISRGA